MLIRADISSDKTEFLTKKYIDLLNQGGSPESIIFLVQNTYRKKGVINFLKSNSANFDNITTFQGLIYRTINQKWKEISSKIKIGENREKPNLCSMELSQFIMRRCIDEVGFKDYFSKINLLHQLFRRYYLIIQNELDEKEVLKRSKILGETWGEEAQKVLKKYEEKTLQYKCFDYLRQMSIFKYIYKNTDGFKNIKYLFLDDGDEITEFEIKFLKHLAPNLKEVFICYDPNGASRAGYLSAKKNIEKDFIGIFKEKPVDYLSKNPVTKRANIIYKNFSDENDKMRIEKLEIKNHITRLEMIKSAGEKVLTLLNKGVKKEEIAIIAPEIDFSLEKFLKKYLGDENLEFLSGNKKLAQDIEVKNYFTVLKLANPDWKLKIEPYEINSLLNNFLGIPIKYCQNIFTEFKKNGKLEDYEFENNKYKKKYENLLAVISTIGDLSLSDSIISIQKIKGSSEKINFLLKQILEFEYLFEKDKMNKKVQKNIVRQFENSMIAENSVEKEVNFKKIIVSTPQKFIDICHKVKYQFWLDITGKGWLVEDVGNIYNAWGFQAENITQKPDFETLYKLTKDKTGRMLRKLALLVNKNIYAFSSCYDSLGFENMYGISDFLSSSQNEISTPTEVKKIIPRDDQKPVLEYKKGNMGIAAVPGAGKTTILLALIIKLLEQKCPPENIFVLTYMDSAAKHFKEKLMEFLPDLKSLPNISTIHGLCLRILKDNSNYVKVNLDPDFQICDELSRKSFITEALYKSNLKEEDYSKYEKALSAAKLNPEINLNSTDKNIFVFKRFFENYNRILYENSMIDYDDMLYYAVKLLEKNPDILKNYQEICHYIIEDEAQDSSLIQQKLLTLLSEKHKNLIRCGDPNQAITTTFTSADTKGFRDFIENNNNVKMSTSQRCAKPVYSFANQLMQNYPDSFFKNIMQGTSDNPKNTEPVSFLDFQNDNEERDFILSEIKNILEKAPKSSIAILLRNNYQVEKYCEFLVSNEIKIVKKIDNLKNNRAYNIILTFFEMLEFPYNNKILAQGLEKLCEYNLYSCQNDDFEKLKNLKEPFLTINPDGLNSHELSKFWWDFDYIFSNSNQELDFLVSLIADYYFYNQTELENAYMLCFLIKSMTKNIKNEQNIIEKLKSVKNLSNLGAINMLKDFDLQENQSKVQVMTIHKSKGDEFDYVFIPEMTEKLFALNHQSVKITSENHFCECLKPKNKRKSSDILIQEQINETLHLIYVAITRAKKRLYMSCPKNIKRGSKNINPCEIFDIDFFRNLSIQGDM